MISDREMQDIVETAAALIRCADDDSFAALIIVPIDVDGKRSQRCDVAILPGCRAVRGELLMINDCFSHGETERFEFFNFFVRLLQPLLEGVSEVRFVRHEALDGLIILPFEPNDRCVPSSHLSSSLSGTEGASFTF